MHRIGDNRDLACDLFDLLIDRGKVVACRIDQFDALRNIADRTVDRTDDIIDTAVVFADQFLDLMTARLAALAKEFDRVVVMGDINIAHTKNDIKNWKGNLKSAGFLPEERAYQDAWLAARRTARPVDTPVAQRFRERHAADGAGTD